MARRKRGLPISGVLLLDKPVGLTSNAALQRVRRLWDAQRGGHTGSLDPMASGVLPICLGEATKFSQHLLDADKGYRATFALGTTTHTADAEGEVLSQVDASHLRREHVEDALAAFRGELLQIPPMVSALKQGGQPLYKLARQGIEVPRAPRPVTIYRYELTDFRPGAVASVTVEVECSKGTYVRSLAADLGAALGVGGHVAALTRTRAGRYALSECIGLAELEAMPVEDRARCLLAADALISDLPRLELEADSAHYFQRGHAVMDLQVYRLGGAGDKVRVALAGGDFLGLGEITDDGRVAPKRLVAAPGSP